MKGISLEKFTYMDKYERRKVAEDLRIKDHYKGLNPEEEEIMKVFHGALPPNTISLNRRMNTLTKNVKNKCY